MGEKTTMTSGIAVDNYKLADFRDGLDRAGFTDRKEAPLTEGKGRLKKLNGTTLISVTHEKSELPRLGQVVGRLNRKSVSGQN